MFTGLFNAIKYGSNYNQQQSQVQPYLPYEQKTDYTPYFIAGAVILGILLLKK